MDLRESSLLTRTADHLEELINTYNTELTQLLDSHAPMKSKIITESENSKWFTGELGDLKREARVLERKHKSTGPTVHQEIYQAKCQE